MQRVSTNWTLFFKFFLPVFWFVFFGSVTVAVLSLRYGYVGNIPRGAFQLIVIFIFTSGLGILYFAFMRLKRVEMSDDFVYVTNYFKNFRYPYHNIEKIRYNNFGLFRSVTIVLRVPGHFGKKITFVPNGQFREFVEEHPELAEKQ